MLESPLSSTWNSSYRGIHTDYPDQIFSGSIAEVVDYLTRVKEKGFDNIYTFVSANLDEYGEARSSAETRYFRDRPETDEEWTSRVERGTQANETRRKDRAAHRSALAKLTVEEREAIKKFGF
jgi:hypothetical protein